MASIDSVSITILFGAVLVLAGIMSSLVALRFGAPLLLVFLLVGMLAGESGLGGIKFDDVRLAYTVGSMALGLILFDGGLRTRLATFRSVLAPAGLLATVGVLITAALTAPVASLLLGMNWTEALAGRRRRGLDRRRGGVLPAPRQRPAAAPARVGATLEVESGINDPFADLPDHRAGRDPALGGEVVEQDRRRCWPAKAVLGGLIGCSRRPRHRARAQPARAAAGPARAVRRHRRAGDLRPGASRCTAPASSPSIWPGWSSATAPTRAHNTIVAFLDAATWLAQIVMFVLLGLLAWPQRLPQRLLPALAVALVLMLDRAARGGLSLPGAVPLPPGAKSCSFPGSACAARVGIFLASIPLLVGLPKRHLYFDIAFVVVLTSLLIQGWTIASPARLLRVALPRADRRCRAASSSTCPGSSKQELVGYPVVADSPYLRRGIMPSWAKLTLVVRDEHILTPEEAGAVRDGDYVYLLAPPEKAQALDRFFVDMPPPAAPDPRLLGTSSFRAT